MGHPINFPFVGSELIVRNIYATSQYSNKKGLKNNFLYPKFNKESSDYPGRRICRISVQRLCYGHWGGIIKNALSTKTEQQTLIGFAFAYSGVMEKYKFRMEPAAHSNNIFHCHIYIPELDVPFVEDESLSILTPALRMKLDLLTEEFHFVKIEDIPNIDISFFNNPLCKECLI